MLKDLIFLMHVSFVGIMSQLFKMLQPEVIHYWYSKDKVLIGTIPEKRDPIVEKNHFEKYVLRVLTDL